MEPEHLLSVRVSDVRSPAAIGLNGAEVVVAVADGNKNLHLHRLFNAGPEMVWPSNHSTAIEQLSLCPCPPLLLASASRDQVLMWDLETTSCLPLPPGEAPPCQRVQLPPFSSGSVSCLCFSPSSQYLVVCDGAEVMVCGREHCQLEFTLRGHSSHITHITFHPHHSHLLITTSEDRTFKVWDLLQCSVLYQSSIISAVPLTCAAVDAHTNTVAIGTADGKLRLLDMSLSGHYQCLLECDVWREMEKHLDTQAPSGGEDTDHGFKVIESRFSWKQPGSCDSKATPTTSTELGTALLGIHYWHTRQQPPSSHISDVLMERTYLVAVGHSALAVLNPNTLQVTGCLDFREPVPSSFSPPSHLLPTAASCGMVTSPSDTQLYCVLEGMFDSSVSLLTLNSRPEGKDAAETGEVISVLSSTPLVPNSLLRAQFNPKPHPSVAKVKPGGQKRKGGGVADKPLTFKTKVKSSGYTDPPRMKMFTPSTASARHAPKPSTTAAAKQGDRRQQGYPMTCGPTTTLHSSLQPPDTPAPITSLKFSGEGQYMCCGCADKVAYLQKMPPSPRRTQALVGHDGAVQSVDWSHNGQWVLSGSSDRTARLWIPGQQEPVLSMSSTQHRHKADPASASGKVQQPRWPAQSQRLTAGGGNSLFPAGISHALFYYLDKFLLLSSSNTLYLCKYHVDCSRPDEIRRYKSLSQYKIVEPIVMQNVQSITALSSINDFLSYIVLVGGSNRSVEVYDMNVAQRVRAVADCHSRPPHCIAQSKGSRGISHPPQAYDIFLTAAPSDGIKLWDLRTNRCVSCFSGHRNRCHPVQATFSPCARYIATGSEDRAAYIYDLRSPSPLHKLTGHSDVVTAVSYHPLQPMLATGTLDGQVKFFTEST